MVVIPCQENNCEAVWTEDSHSVTVGVVVDEEVRGKQVELEVRPSWMVLTIRGSVVLQGEVAQHLCTYRR